MKTQAILEQARALVAPFRVTDGRRFHLKDIRPDATAGLKSRDEAKDQLEQSLRLLSTLQAQLYAQDRWALLLVFQAMDAAGKDSTIKHVMSGVDPHGCQVFSFKAPTSRELDHDYLWRTTVCLPERGRIGIFNRSYYEEVLIVRVHPELLARQRLAPGLVTGRVWQERFEDINHFERYLARNGVVVRKFFLHVSKAEQKRRFLERLERPEKNWKFTLPDMQERKYWRQYRDAYEDMIRQTATAHAPWHVVPADNKWFTRLVVASAIVETLGSLKLRYPEVDPAKRRELAAGRRALLQE